MTTLKDAFDKFIMIKTASMRAEATIRWYTTMLMPMITEIGQGIDVTKISEDDMLEYVVSLRSRDTRYQDAKQKPEQPGGLSHESLRGHIRATKAFWQWVSKRYMMLDPMREIKVPKAINTGLKDMKPSVYRALFEATRDTQTGTRDRAFMAIVADSGGRAGEVLQMTFEKLDTIQRECPVIGKYSKLRLLHWGKKANLFLQNWIDKHPTKTGAVWTSSNTGAAITYSGIAQRMEVLAIKSGVADENYNLHAARHSFALMCAESGMNQSLLTSLLGHSSTDTTKRYYHRFQERQLREAQQRHSPFEKLIDEE